MGFYARIISDFADNISVNKALSCVGEVKRGSMTYSEAYDTMTLNDDSAGQAEFNALVDYVETLQDVDNIWNCLYLSKAKVPGYVTESELKTKIGV